MIAFLPAKMCPAARCCSDGQQNESTRNAADCFFPILIYDVVYRGIIRVAGGPGDRWLGHREMAGREESPDTVLRHAGHVASVIFGEREAIGGTLDRATRLVTPGGAMGRP